MKNEVAETLPSSSAETAESHAPQIEIGIVCTGEYRDASYRAAAVAAERVQQRLQAEFPEFEFLCRIHHRRCPPPAARIEPAELLQVGTEERDAHDWDFAVVVTPGDLACRYQPFAYGVVSRSLDLVVLSTARLGQLGESEGEAAAALALESLMLHTFGHLNGLVDETEPGNVMCDPQNSNGIAGDSAGMLHERREFNDRQRKSLARNLNEIADIRLEERDDAEGIANLGFYLRGSWLNGHKIVDAVIQARPWEFPVRLARLTAAAVSSVLLLLITAETWDLALNQSPLAVGGLFSMTLLSTTGYVIQRQRLLVTRRKRRMTEQAVIANLSAVGIVFIGMATTALLLFLLALAAGYGLFPEDLVASWASSVHRSPEGNDYLQLALFVASVGILVGALGASFEEQRHFRHIVLVDEEV